jgi:predicted nucleic acid-binding protein
VIVIDASVLASALADDGSDGAAARLIVREAGALSAPDVVDIETVSVFRKWWRAGNLTVPRFRSAVDDLDDLALERYPTGGFMHRAYELRANVTPADAAYVALAEALDCPLVTADERLARAPGPRCDFHVLRV